MMMRLLYQKNSKSCVAKNVDSANPILVMIASSSHPRRTATESSRSRPPSSRLVLLAASAILLLLLLLLLQLIQLPLMMPTTVEAWTTTTTTSSCMRTTSLANTRTRGHRLLHNNNNNKENKNNHQTGWGVTCQTTHLWAVSKAESEEESNNHHQQQQQQQQQQQRQHSPSRQAINNNNGQHKNNNTTASASTREPPTHHNHQHQRSSSNSDRPRLSKTPAEIDSLLNNPSSSSSSSSGTENNAGIPVQSAIDNNNNSDADNDDIDYEDDGDSFKDQKQNMHRTSSLSDVNTHEINNHNHNNNNIRPDVPDQAKPTTAAVTTERALYRAVKRGNLPEAAQQQAALDQAHLEDAGAVLQAHASLYRAIRQKDTDQVMSHWSHHVADTASLCTIWPNTNVVGTSVPPPGSSGGSSNNNNNNNKNNSNNNIGIVGYKAVRQAWHNLLHARPAGTTFSSWWLEPQAVKLVSMKLNSIAIVTCTENVMVRKFKRAAAKETKCINQLTSTQIYRKVVMEDYTENNDNIEGADLNDDEIITETGDNGGTWKLIHYHSSWAASSQAGQAALRAIHGDYDEEDEDSDNYNLDEDPLGGILGVRSFQADLVGLGGQKASSNKKALTSPPRIIVRQSLSDLLHGGDSKKKSGIGSDDMMLGGGASGAWKDLFGANANIDKKTGLPLDAIVRLQRLDSSSSSNKNDEEDNDDDDDDEDDYDEVEETEYLDLDEEYDEDDEDDRDDQADIDRRELRRFRKEQQERENLKKDLPVQQQQSKQSNDKASTAATTTTASSLRQSCIALLRHLTQQGMLSPRQKRLLLTDIIYSNANGETSMVEMAYELLVMDSSSAQQEGNLNSKNNADNDWTAMVQEEFADQCRVLVDDLSKDEASS